MHSIFYAILLLDCGVETGKECSLLPYVAGGNICRSWSIVHGKYADDKINALSRFQRHLRELISKSSLITSLIILRCHLK